MHAQTGAIFIFPFHGLCRSRPNLTPFSTTEAYINCDYKEDSSPWPPGYARAHSYAALSQRNRARLNTKPTPTCTAWKSWPKVVKRNKKLTHSLILDDNKNHHYRAWIFQSSDGCYNLVSSPFVNRNKNSSGDEIANVNFYALRPQLEATRIRWNNTK